MFSDYIPNQCLRFTTFKMCTCVNNINARIQSSDEGFPIIWIAIVDTVCTKTDARNLLISFRYPSC
jgi:hypothetical protein